MIMSMGVGTANSIVAQSTGFFVQDRLGLTAHGSIAVSGSALSLAAACSVAMQIVAIRLRPAASTLIIFGAASVGLATSAVVMMPSAGLLLPAMGVVGAGIGACSLGISTAASLMTRPNQQGGVAGSLASASSLGAIVSALAVMPFYERLPDFPYLAAAMLGAGVVVGWHCGKTGDARAADAARGFLIPATGS